MKYTLQFFPEFEQDIMTAYIWYESKSVGLGEEFLRIFYACVIEIRLNPLRYMKVYSKFRRCLLRRFPYAIYFIIKEDSIIVFGLFHCARDPRTIGMRLQDRADSERT